MGNRSVARGRSGIAVGNKGRKVYIVGYFFDFSYIIVKNVTLFVKNERRGLGIFCIPTFEIFR